MKINTTLKILGAMVITLWSGQPAWSTSFILGDYVYTVRDNANTVITGTTQLRFGFFANGFTPTANNANLWLSNFTGVSGYFDGSGPEWSAGIPLSNNSVYAVGTQLSVIIFNFGVSANASSLLASGLSANYQAAVITNPLWTITAASGSDPTAYNFSLDGKLVDTGTSQIPTSGASTALVGTLSSSSVTLVPEPSTGALMMIGAVGLVALRRLRKV